MHMCVVYARMVHTGAGKFTFEASRYMQYAFASLAPWKCRCVRAARETRFPGEERDVTFAQKAHVRLLTKSRLRKFVSLGDI